MTSAPSRPAIELVTEPTRLTAALARIDEPVVGVDVERADSLRYHRHAALVQVGAAGRCVLIDGTTIDRLDIVEEFLTAPDRLAVLHAAVNDLEPLRVRGVTIPRMADTALAASMIGLPTGLDALLEQLLGVTLAGDKAAMQRADWERRPLSDDLVEYAAGDVVHLPALWSHLSARLDELGRADWYDQELDALRTTATTNDRDWRRVKGARRLDAHQRAALEAVWHRREELAREHDIAPNVLLRDEVLLDIARTPPANAAALISRSPRRRGVLRPHAGALLDAVHRAGDRPVEDFSPGRRRADDTEDSRRLTAMRRARSALADELGLDSGVLCPARALTAAIGADPADADALIADAGLTGWRAELLRDVLWQAYSSEPD